jgi:hypothetical protein
MCAEWAQLIGGIGTAAAGSTPRSAPDQGMMPEGTDLIDARVIFAAAEKGDIRVLAQTSLKLVEAANKTIGALSQQVPAKERYYTYMHTCMTCYIYRAMGSVIVLLVCASDTKLSRCVSTSSYSWRTSS